MDGGQGGQTRNGLSHPRPQWTFPPGLEKLCSSREQHPASLWQLLLAATAAQHLSRLGLEAGNLDTANLEGWKAFYSDLPVGGASTRLISGLTRVKHS